LKEVDGSGDPTFGGDTRRSKESESDEERHPAPVRLMEREIFLSVALA
jgi:hypothetical protein